jgi:HEAT repeat protein
MLASPSPEIQFEAVRAAGELELVGLREEMLSLLQDGVEDEEVRLALIWALSQIGGDDVKERLEELLADAFETTKKSNGSNAPSNMDFSTSGN